jgi:hypothetical protein
MGTNFYRTPMEEEMLHRKKALIDRIVDMELTSQNIESDFNYISINENDWNKMSPWDEFLNGTKIHLGKRSHGWKFVWNFNKNRYYSSKEDLFEFIRSGRVVDEYGRLIPNEEFIEDALEWEQPNGLIYNENYVKSHPTEALFNMSEHYCKIIDGLVVSPHDDFC